MPVTTSTTVENDGNRQASVAGSPPAPLKSAKFRALSNAVWNWLGTAIELLVALLLTPFLIRSLGESAYGAWIVIGSLTGYLGVLDFGLRGSVGRHVAFYQARNDRDGLLSTLNTAAFALAIIGAVSLGIVCFLARYLELLTDVSAALLPEARTAMYIVGAHLALWFVMRIFDATLWGFQRFDLLNMVDIPAALFRGVASTAVILNGYGLAGLAWVTLAITIGVGLAKTLLCRLVEPQLAPSVTHVRLAAFRELWGYGIWNTLVSLGGMARTQLSPVAVGAALGLSMVTPFSVVMRLVGTAATIITSGTGVLTPYAAALHANDEADKQRSLFLESGKFCVGAAIFFVALFVLLGKSLLGLWIGPQLEWAWQPLLILICGELAPMSVIMGSNTILGMARNRSLAVGGLAECVTALVLGLLLYRPFGLNGVCASLAIAGTCWRGVFVFSQAAPLIDLTFKQFVIRSVLPMLAAATLPIAILITANSIRKPDTWLQLCLYGGVFSVLNVLTALIAAWGFSGLRARTLNRLQPACDETARSAV